MQLFKTNSTLQKTIFTGFDTPKQLNANDMKNLKNNKTNFDFIGRYFGQNTHKILTPQEAQLIAKNGYKIVSVYEDGPTEISYFTQARARADAQRIVVQATKCKQPANTINYATADYDVTPNDLEQVFEYFVTVHNYLKSYGYLTGAYGNGLLLAKLLQEGYIHSAWLAQSTGWAGYDNFKNSNKYSILQGPTSTFFNIDMDSDRAQGDFGAWTPTK